MDSNEVDLERARVACVFCLGGGELHQPDERFPDEWDGVFAHWFEGAPDYATDLKEINEVTCPTCKGTKIDPAPADQEPAECPACEGMGHLDLEVRTVIMCCLFGHPTPPAGWTQAATYSSSGERECWSCTDRDNDHEDGEDGSEGCKVCEGEGLVYLGDGWCEVVYRRVA